MPTKVLCICYNDIFHFNSIKLEIVKTQFGNRLQELQATGPVIVMS